MADDERTIKHARLTGFLDRHKLDGVWLQSRANFAWITGGRRNHVSVATPVGASAIYATRQRLTCFASAIEAPRMRHEELIDTDIETIAFPWWDPAAAKRTIGDVLGDGRVAADHDTTGLNLPPLPGDWAELRWSLTPEEVARYREGGRRASAAIEAACHELQRGMTEQQIAGLLNGHLYAQGTVPMVALVAADERIGRYRHPIPTGNRLARCAMLVSGSEFGGLVSSLTRFVHFGPRSGELAARHQAVCNVDAAVITATQVGRTLGEIFATLQRAYAANGGANQWHLHHQGGSAGYLGREAIANPASTVKVVANQAFAWNPSMIGVKSEDTVLVSSATPEVLTVHSGAWPTVLGEYEGQRLARPGMLVR
jgi:Xaa-Pro aminopeptidase